MCVSVALYGFNLSGSVGPHVSGCTFLNSPCLGGLATIALNLLYIPFSFLSSMFPIVHILFLLLISPKSCRLSLRFFIPFSFCSYDQVISNSLSSSLLLGQVCCCSSLLNSSVQPQCSSAPRFMYSFSFFYFIVE